MPVEKPDVIDIMTHNPKTGELMLVMVETRDWRVAKEAATQLEPKIRYYAEFVASGALPRQYPDLAKCPTLIALHHFQPLTNEVEEILQSWANRLSAIPIGICSSRSHWNPLSAFFARLRRQPPIVRWRPDPASVNRLLTVSQFGEEFVKAWREQRPNLKIEPVSGSEVNVTNSEGVQRPAFLDNAYKHFLLDPENKDEVIRKYIGAFLETDSVQDKSLDKNRIVPILKDRAWLYDIQTGLKARGGEKSMESVYEAYNDELTVFYAEDNPKTMRYLTPSDLATAGLEKANLRKVACSNLQKLIGAPDVQFDGGIYRVMAGGDYDACLLLLDEFWDTADIPIDGEMVVAVPSRNFLGVVGSEDKSGVRVLKQLAVSIAASAPYRLTSKLFVRRNGKFLPYEEDK